MSVLQFTSPMSESENIMTEKHPVPADLPVNPATGEIVASPEDYLIGIPIVLEVEDLAEQTFQRILQADTPEEALFNPEAEGLLQYAGSTITLTAVTGISPSTVRDHTDEYYLRFEAITPKGVTSLSTGSPYAMRQIVKLAAAGWLPRRVRVLELVSKSDNTRSSLWVVDAGSVVEGVDGEQPF